MSASRAFPCPSGSKQPPCCVFLVGCLFVGIKSLENNSWLGIQYVDRTFFDAVATEASIRRMREILDEAKGDEEASPC